MTLTTEDKMLIEQRVANDAKSIGVAYLLWLFLGCFGAHRFYLGTTGSAIAIVALTIIGALTSALLIGLPLLLIVAIWLIVDAFLIPGMIQSDKDALRARLTQAA